MKPKEILMHKYWFLYLLKIKKKNYIRGDVQLQKCLLLVLEIKETKDFVINKDSQKSLSHKPFSKLS